MFSGMHTQRRARSGSLACRCMGIGENTCLLRGIVESRFRFGFPCVAKAYGMSDQIPRPCCVVRVCFEDGDGWLFCIGLIATLIAD